MCIYFNIPVFGCQPFFEKLYKFAEPDTRFCGRFLQIVRQVSTRAFGRRGNLHKAISLPPAVIRQAQKKHPGGCFFCALDQFAK